nr:DEAD-like helicase [Wheat associated tobamo-like virus]
MESIPFDDTNIPINFQFCDSYVNRFCVNGKFFEYNHAGYNFLFTKHVHDKFLGGAKNIRSRNFCSYTEVDSYLKAAAAEYLNAKIARQYAERKAEQARQQQEEYERELTRKREIAQREMDELARHQAEFAEEKCAEDADEEAKKAAELRNLKNVAKNKAKKSRASVLHSRLSSISGPSRAKSGFHSNEDNGVTSFSAAITAVQNSFDTVTPRPRDGLVKETRVDVDRNKYERIADIITRDSPGWIICGPTGCGKSTVALLPLLRDKTKRTIIVEPTVANAGNIMQEFECSIPNLFKNGVIKEKPMGVAYTDFKDKNLSKVFTNLYVTTVPALLAFFRKTGNLPRADYWVIDEFHLPIQDMVTTVMLFKAMDVKAKYILVSATIPGVKVNASIPADVSTKIDDNIKPTIPRLIKNTFLDPNRYKKEGNSIAVVAPSVSIARMLSKRYKDSGYRVWTITRYTGVETYKKAVRDREKRIYVLEPGVEAGITLPMSVLISMGATSAIRYDGKVVLEETQPLDKIAEIQRASRGGRVIPTLYVRPPALNKVNNTDDPAYYQANAAVELVALGVDPSMFKTYAFLKDFPKVSDISQELARSAMEADCDRPLIAAYQYNEKGEKYKECGGNGDGFARLAAKELSLYHWPAGFFIAPIADFSDLNTDPTKFVSREGQLVGAKAMVATIPGLKRKAKLADLIQMIKRDMVQFLPDLFRVLKRVIDATKQQFMTYSDLPPNEGRHPTIGDVVGDPDVTSLIYAMSLQPSVEFEQDMPDFKFDEEKRTVSCNAAYSLTYEGETMFIGFSSKWKDGARYDVAKIRDAVKEQLEEVLAVPLLKEHAPDRCVNLSNYVNRVTTEQKWFASNVY